MTASTLDDLEAVRIIVDTLGKFDEPEKERILRWALEKMGMMQPSAPPSHTLFAPTEARNTSSTTPTPAIAERAADIKSFVLEKKPSSDNQFAAVVAYYYRFEAPEGMRKNTINGVDLQEAARQAGTKRLARPGQTLINAHGQGYFDKGNDGYSLNTVGENLVAMALPENSSTTTPRRRPAKPTAKKSAIKKK